MKHEYDLFEKFPDGSSLWRDSGLGFEAARLRLRELAKRSKNQFYAINLTTGEVFVFSLEGDAPRFRVCSRPEKQSKSQAA